MDASQLPYPNLLDRDIAMLRSGSPPGFRYRCHSRIHV